MRLPKGLNYHLLLALVLIAMSYFEDYTLGGKKGFLSNFTPYFFSLNITFYLSSTIIYFINFSIICPKLLKKNMWLYLVICFLGLILLFAGLRYVLDEIVLYHIFNIHNYVEGSRKFFYYIFDNSYFALNTILYSTLIYLFLDFREKKNHEKAQLNALKAQISPHFLFNILNAFYVDLLEDKPETAKDIHRLSELLRYVTYESKEDFVLLKKEVQFLEDYIAIYSRRYENDLAVIFEIKGNLTDVKIPSLILIHFVENLFKHGVVNDKNNPAEIKIVINKKALELETQNKILESVNHISSGIGSENIKKRLNSIYNDHYKLTYFNKNEYFKAYLKIPL
ncbi:histidine kinase [Polaribacter batillariae]|uniref:Histidine kinase n=1 Tax=Polaribacter batillariae TaxID=2808900 RepID=A0ABX7SUI2_9FLAO|nr:histidine kinase [Polaribacter batillariae]QTD37892.1 histidine kinase [Polaribacter batillariae]